VTGDLANAELLLREIAHELVSIPLDERARGLHLRVLALKRTVSAWSSQPPELATSEATFAELRALHTEVCEVRSTSEVRLRTTDRISYRPASYRPAKMR
jgi:hypothetical protein